MDAFGDDADFAAAQGAGETSDPAADFLAREQAELGEDLGQELGLDAGAAPSPPQATLDEVNINIRKKPMQIDLISTLRAFTHDPHIELFTLGCNKWVNNWSRKYGNWVRRTLFSPICNACTSKRGARDYP